MGTAEIGVHGKSPERTVTTSRFRPDTLTPEAGVHIAGDHPELRENNSGTTDT